MMGALLARASAASLAITVWCADASGFPTSRLTYARGTGAERCPEESTVRQAVAARLGYDPFFAAADKTIVARILRNRDELRATVELVDDRGIVQGVREFKSRAGQCDELVATMALAISIAIDPTNPGVLGEPPKVRPETPKPRAEPPKARSPVQNQPSTTIVRVTPAAEPPDADVPETPSSDRGSSYELRLGAAAIGAAGTAPGPTAGLALSAGVRSGWWSLSAEGRSELPATVSVGTERIRTSLWAAALVPCAHFDPMFVCATGWLGSLRAQGVGFPTSRIDHATYVAAGPRFGLDLRIGERLTFRPYFDVLANLFPVALNVDGTTQWAAPQISALIGAALVVRFP